MRIDEALITFINMAEKKVEAGLKELEARDVTDPKYNDILQATTVTLEKSLAYSNILNQFAQAKAAANNAAKENNESHNKGE